MPSRLPLLFAAATVLTACAGPAGSPPQDANGWHSVALPGKAETRYRWVAKDGRPAIEARSERSASMWRRRLALQPGDYGDVSFAWWVPELIAGADPSRVDSEDSPVRVLIGFGGDRNRLPARTRAMFDLAEALTGEQPPYATLMYVWVPEAPVGSVIVNPRSDRIRKIVLASGTLGLKRWQDHRRNLVEDYRRAFGEEPGPLVSVAIMTDSDNTRSKALAWYGEIEFIAASP
ncbi:MAG: DUF3047 domain-containing protein [Rubrivivax sp.]|jgi:hypothetical protein|nr:DUF3047 domain-containing protein [Rubrivivax sp.]